MNRLKIFRSIAIDALFLALFILFTFVPWLGYYQVGPISFQVVHVFVLIGAAIFGWKKGLLYGFIFGLLSLLKAISYPGTLDFAFINPFVSILPRALFGFLAGFIFDIIKKHASLKQFIISLPVLCFVLTCFHTFATLSCLYIFGVLDPFSISSALGLSEIMSNVTFVALFTTIGLIGMCIEGAVAAIIVLPLYVALRRINFVKEEDDLKFKTIKA